jgi:hypothetical protein
VDLDPDRLTDEGGELIDKLNEWLGSDSDAGSELGKADEDDPEWDFEEGETQVKDLTYVFCPAPHRKPILHLFTKHFCQHLAFSEWNEGPCSAMEIRKRAVIEMYQFCRQRGLREAWGYLWTSWYVPPKWKLWACSTSPYVSQWRTTMGTENFWKQLKHNHLHHMLRPRLDLLVWILITKVTPKYIAHAEVLEDTHHLGRSKPLSTYQKCFKSSWKQLVEASVSGIIYVTCGHAIADSKSIIASTSANTLSNQYNLPPCTSGIKLSVAALCHFITTLLLYLISKKWRLSTPIQMKAVSLMEMIMFGWEIQICWWKANGESLILRGC